MKKNEKEEKEKVEGKRKRRRKEVSFRKENYISLICN
jgi:hypothetical protein